MRRPWLLLACAALLGPGNAGYAWAQAGPYDASEDAPASRAPGSSPDPEDTSPREPRGASVAAELADGAPRRPREDAPDDRDSEGRPAVRVRYLLEGIEIVGNARTAARVILRYVHFQAGDVLDVNDAEIELTRYRLLGTGFFKSVTLSLRRGARRGGARLVIEVEERNTLVVQNLWLGIAADEDTAGNARPLSAFLGVQAAETNLAGTGITLGAGVGLAADQLAIRTEFIDPAFAGTAWSAVVRLLYNDARDFFGNREVYFESPLLEQREVTSYAVVAYKRFGAMLGTGHDISISTRFWLNYHLEQIDATVPTVASHMRGARREPIDFSIQRGTSTLSALSAGLYSDTRDGPILPQSGTLASARLKLGAPPLGSDYGYARVELEAQRWWRLPWRHVVRLDAFAGAIAGDAPFFEKFYVGDFTDFLPDRLLDLAPDRRQPPNFLGTNIVEIRYGDFAARLGGEYRIPIYAGRGSIYGADVFASAALYAVGTRREITDPASGYEGLARVPVDFTYNFGLRLNTSFGGATLAFSNLIGLAPSRGDRR